jgi:hypothetical protein
VWQVQWELDDDDLASLPETGWTVKDAVRDDDYDNCDGFAYTIVHPGIEEEFVVSASALFKPSKPVRKPKGRALESDKKFGKKFSLYERYAQYKQDDVKGKTGIADDLVGGKAKEFQIGLSYQYTPNLSFTVDYTKMDGQMKWGGVFKDAEDKVIRFRTYLSF